MKNYLVILSALLVNLALTAPAQAVDTPRTPTITHQGSVNIVTWQGLDGDDTGVPVSALNCKKPLSVQIGLQGGNTHGSGTFVLQGSNDSQADPSAASYASAVWVTMTDPQGNAISRTTANLYEQVEEVPLWLRPSSSGGTASDMDIVLTCQQ